MAYKSPRTFIVPITNKNMEYEQTNKDSKIIFLENDNQHWNKNLALKAYKQLLGDTVITVYNDW